MPIQLRLDASILIACTSCLKPEYSPLIGQTLAKYGLQQWYNDVIPIPVFEHLIIRQTMQASIPRMYKYITPACWQTLHNSWLITSQQKTLETAVTSSDCPVVDGGPQEIDGTGTGLRPVTGNSDLTFSDNT